MTHWVGFNSLLEKNHQIQNIASLLNKIRQQAQQWLTNLGQAYGNLPQAFRLIWQASPGAAWTMAGLALLGGLLPPAFAWTTKLIIDGVTGLSQQGVAPWTGVTTMLPVLLLELVLLLIMTASNQTRTLIEKILHGRLGLHINEQIMGKALGLDLSYFEEAQFYDKLQNARQQVDTRTLDIVVESFALFRNLITFAFFAILLIRFSPWLIVILFGATLPSFGAQHKFGRLVFRLQNSQAPERRQLDYISTLLTEDRSAKEVKLFGLGTMFLRRYANLFWQHFHADTKLARRRSLLSIGWGTLGSVSYYGVACWILFAALGRQITLGDAVLFLEVFRQSHWIVQSLLEASSKLYENSLFLNNLFDYLALKPRRPSASVPSKLPSPMHQGIEFRNVSFRYPGQESWALHDVNLTLHPNEKLAVVGLNGAGKTTLIKLLTGLYEPTKGEILVDGVDLRQIDQQAWWQKVGVIFQDFIRYQLSAAENIGVGQVEALDQRAQIEAAAKQGGADEVVDTLPKGYDTTLGKWFAEGHELSGGQWQKIALSRAFMRNADILVLDEPTAALDAEQEQRIFQHFRQLTEGKMAILISHRFSTVRMADRIAVIEGGRIQELGSHDELMVRDGEYARLFRIQAAGYQE
ncbi:MAG: ABC transporter ATP-binding protein [Chloroflexota bacterium]